MQPTKKKTVVSVRDKLDGNEIDLSLLELTDVPVRELAQVTRGTKLDLSNNQLVTLTVAFPSLTHLVELDLSRNQLKELPVNFGDLRNLKKLDLYSNQLQRLPVSFHQLKELRWLDLKNNPLVSTLAEAAGDCLDQKGCQEAAKKVVKLMTVVHSELEKKRLKEQEESKAQVARKQQEERAKEQQARAEKKAEKEKRRAEQLATSSAAKQQSEAMAPASKVQGDNKSRTDDVKNGKKGQKQSQRQQAQKAVQGQSFCVRLFVILARLLFLAALVFAVVFAFNWKGPATLDNAGVVARRSVDQVVRQSREAYDWAYPRLEPVREQWKQLSRFVSDNGRDLIFIAWDKTVQYGKAVQHQAVVLWPVVQERASEAAGLAAHYWRIVCQEAPVYYQSVMDKLFAQESQRPGPQSPTSGKGA